MQTNDRLLIRDLLENWAVWRDAGDWERFATVWHPGARMVATWFDGDARDFIAASRRAFSEGAVAHHILGGSSIDLRGARAVAQTKMILSVRVRLDGTLCDVEVYGRFYDLLEKLGDAWKISVRRCIYEKDRIDPVDRSTPLQLDPQVLSRYPEGYRHLAYAQTQRGFAVPANLPGLRGPEVEQLYATGATWLAGESGPG